MKENKLIASVVVFKELLDNNKDVYDVIAEFIRAAVLDRKMWSFNSTECKHLLEEVFDFKLPEAVIKTVLKNRLVKKNFISIHKSTGSYVVNNPEEKLDSVFETNFEEKKLLYRETENDFVNFIQKKRKTALTAKEKGKISENISHYLLGNGVNEPYTAEISEYIIQRKADKEFSERLNLVKEGVVLYTGVRYTADLNDLGTWKQPLTIFLDTEILFDYVGYNGLVFQEIAMDFFKLVREINAKAEKKEKKKKIQLKYFSETENEIHKFFHVATLIIENKASLDPSKAAMKEIINGCTTKSDIIVKKNKFFIDLQTSGIHLEENKDYYEEHQYNIEDKQILEELAKQAKENNKEFDEEYCKNYLKLFTKINVLRRGKNDVGFDNCKYILLTGNNYIKFLAHRVQIKSNEKDIPFATDLDFITDKFWFKLKKGFGASDDIPRSFNIITKAQIVLSAQIKNSVQEKFTALNEKYKKGEISKEEAISLTYSLRDNSRKPEEINENNLEESICFINEASIEAQLKEREIFLQKLKEGEIAKAELRRRDRIARTEKTGPIKRNYRALRIAFTIGKTIFIIAFIFIIFLGINYLKETSDTLLGVLGLALTLIVLFPIRKSWKNLSKILDKKIIELFRDKIKSLEIF